MIVVVKSVRKVCGPFLALLFASMLVAAPAHAHPSMTPAALDRYALSNIAPSLTDVRYRRTASQDANEAAALFDEGQYEYDAQDYRAAQRIFERLVEAYPSSNYALKAQRYLANIYRRLDERHQRINRVKREVLDQRSLPPRSPKQISIPRQSSSGYSRAAITPPPIVRPDKAMQRKLLLQVGDRVFFAADSKQIGAKARTVLRRQAKWLKSNKNLSVRIEGHSHDNGGSDTDLVLSLQRAEQVRNRLIEEGVSPDRISVFGRGRASPVAPCDNAMCAAQNRRVVTIVYRSQEKASSRHSASLPQPQR